MKKIKESKERSWYLVDEWVTKSGLKAQVNKCEWNADLKNLGPSLHDFYTGYVQVPDGIVPNESNIEVHGGVTFSLGKLPDADGMWIGFDMAHFGDENMQDIEYAKRECEKLASQIK